MRGIDRKDRPLLFHVSFIGVKRCVPFWSTERESPSFSLPTAAGVCASDRMKNRSKEQGAEIFLRLFLVFVFWCSAPAPGVHSHGRLTSEFHDVRDRIYSSLFFVAAPSNSSHQRFHAFLETSEKKERAECDGWQNTSECMYYFLRENISISSSMEVGSVVWAKWKSRKREIDEHTSCTREWNRRHGRGARKERK